MQKNSTSEVMENEKIKHPSHRKHELILNELQKIKNEDGEKELICYGCQEQILELKAYCCLYCDEFFLHKRCAELHDEITHPMHSEHPLILRMEPTYIGNTCICNACGQKWKFFTYNCDLCKFDLDICCAMLETGFKHENHDHPLVQQRSATFYCNACCVVGEDSSYLCTTCPFWIHKRCALMPQEVDYKDDDHRLLLARSIPHEYRKFKQKCGVCHDKVGPDYWIYYCSRCRYFIHFRCILISQDAKQQSSGDINDSISDGKLGLEDRNQCSNKQNLFKLPLPHAAREFFTHLLHKRDESGGTTSSGETKIEEIIHVKAHEHSLILSTKVQEVESEVVIGKGTETNLVCDWCIEPIWSYDLHYTCADCSYFLHLACYKFPSELQTPMHTQHSLSLTYEKYDVGHFICSACDCNSNGHYYKCKHCKFRRYLCMKCASVTMIPTITHKAHKHLLTQVESFYSCNACGFKTKFGFGCEEDCHFYLCYTCAMLPPSVKQRWDKHQLILVYPPYSEHPEEFYCVLCEQEMNPNYWMYHCGECDYSLHPLCIPEISLLRHWKFGRSLWVKDHPHPLINVREAKEDSFCVGCKTSLEWNTAFECIEYECGLYVCLKCAFSD